MVKNVGTFYGSHSEFFTRVKGAGMQNSAGPYHIKYAPTYQNFLSLHPETTSTSITTEE